MKRAKLSVSQVAEIRTVAVGIYGEHRPLARKYGVTPSSISRILSNEAYPDPLYTPKDRVYHCVRTLKEFNFFLLERNEFECMEWIGTRFPKGYGRISMGKPTEYAHRWLWIATHGIIDDEIIVRHKCDNPPCCNIEHLEIGTPQDNMDDKHARGRAVYLSGQEASRAKLTEEQVREIRNRYSMGNISQKNLGKEYGVSQRSICRIVNNEVYKS